VRGNGGPGRAARADDDLKHASHREKTNAYLIRIGAEWRNFRKAVVQEGEGKYQRVIAQIRFGNDGAVEGPDHFKPTPEEAEAIKAEFLAHGSPDSQPYLCTGKRFDPKAELVKFGLPPDRPGEPSTFSVFWNEAHDHILMIEQRIDKGPGDKAVIPWSYWSDRKWRPMEPDGDLPLYGLEQLPKNTTVFLHEGTKAARFCRALVEGNLKSEVARREAHPWGKELASGVHLAWIGGAPNAHRTDWSPMKSRPDLKVIVVADRDRPGEDAVRDISKVLKRGMKAILFDKTFPEGFDLADPWPAEHFGTRNGAPLYVGPTFQDCMNSVTWATVAVPSSTPGRPSHRLTPAFLDEWRWTVRPPFYVHRDNPSRPYTEDEFNASVRPLSDVDNTARLLKTSLSAKLDGVTYNPGVPSGAVIEKASGERLINTYASSGIEPAPGSAMPWLRFLCHLFPNRHDRRAAAKWIATLIARPDIRMEYSLLLVSERQGVGKTTLCDILARLVGSGNYSCPPPSDVINGDFNTWAARKRLVIINEIYEGWTKRAYNKLKTYITDKEFQCHEKYQKPYPMPLYTHIVGCSNYAKAVYLEDEDRRWLVPGVTERPKPKEYWAAFYDWWTRGNGLRIIRRWADEYVAKHGPVTPGDRAPRSNAKDEMIEEHLTESFKLVRALGEAIAERKDQPDGEYVLPERDVLSWVSQQVVFDQSKPSPAMIRKALKTAGLHISRKRMKIWGHLQYAVANIEIPPDYSWEKDKRRYRQKGINELNALMPRPLIVQRGEGDAGAARGEETGAGGRPS
jgi:hypothetical protein